MNDIFLLFIIPLAFVLFLCVFVFLINKPYYSLAVYFAGVFIRTIILKEIQVRFQVMIDLILITILLLIVLIANMIRKEKAWFPVRVPCFDGAVVIVALVVTVEALNGLLNEYAVFQILVDIYKVVEILIFFVFVRMTIKTSEQADKVLYALTGEMCFFGVVELFTTERGGTGLNILMFILPIVFAIRLGKKLPYFAGIILIAATVLFLSKTRTYIIGMVFGLFIVLYLGKGSYKHQMVRGCIGATIIAMVFIFTFGNTLQNSAVGEVLGRFEILFNEGFSGAGGYRIYEIQTAITKFLEAPLIGKGYGYLENVYIKLMGNFTWGDFMHNTYVEILCKTGIFGSLVYGYGIIAYLHKQYELICYTEKRKWTECQNILIGGLGSTLSWLLVYAAAPLSSYGSVFLPGIFSLTYYSLYAKEKENLLG